MPYDLYLLVLPLQNNAKQKIPLDIGLYKGKQPDTKVQQAVQQTLNLNAFRFVVLPMEKC